MKKDKDKAWRIAQVIVALVTVVGFFFVTRVLMS